MTFTMKYAAHPERRTAFQNQAQALQLIHATIAKGQPWRNGIIERTHRTDNEELFDQMHFASSEERQYQLCLWEMEYNNRRPHQGLEGKCPLEVLREEYRLHAATRMLM
jgi:transposase InsO family protein